MTPDLDPFFIVRAYPPLSASVSNHSFKARKPTAHSWTRTENNLYVAFLKENIDILSNREKRKSEKVFSLMAKKVGTKTACQAKSHHQKLVARYVRVRNIIEHLEYF